MMDNIREILSDDFEQASRMPLNRIKYMREEMSNRIQPWQETSFQLFNEKTARKTTARQLFTKRKNRHRCHKTTERQASFIAEVDQNMNQSMKWTLQSQFLYQKQKKFSSLLKMKNPGHFRSNTLKSQENFQIEQSNAKNRKVSFKQVYQTLSSIQKKNEIESRMEKKRLSSARKPVVQKISKVKKKQMSVCPAIIQLSQKNLQKITKNNFYKPRICKPKKAKQMTFSTIESFRISKYLTK